MCVCVVVVGFGWATYRLHSRQRSREFANVARSPQTIRASLRSARLSHLQPMHERARGGKLGCVLKEGSFLPCTPLSASIDLEKGLFSAVAR